MARVKKAEAREKEEAKKLAEERSLQRSSGSSQYTETTSSSSKSSYSDLDPLSWRAEESRDEARLGYDKAPYRCRRCGMRSFDPLDDGVRGVGGICIDCLNYLVLYQ